MSRPLRIEFPGVTYHVTSRGDRRELIYRDHADRDAQLAVIAQATARLAAQVLAYCLMGHHFHLVLCTRQANLSRLMRQVNEVYTQAFNWRHGLAGYLVQGCCKAILVDRDAYLLTLRRCVERNPAAAGIVSAPEDWPWSSCRAHLSQAETPPWLDSDGLHADLLGVPVQKEADRQRTVRLWAKWVSQSRDDDEMLWNDALHHQIFLGDESFMKRRQGHAEPGRLLHKAIPKGQRLWPLTFERCLTQCAGDLGRALHRAYREGGVTMAALAQQARLLVTHVSRLIASAENAKSSCDVLGCRVSKV